MTLVAELVIASTELGMAAANLQQGGEPGDGGGLSWESYVDAWKEHPLPMLIGHGLLYIFTQIATSGSGRRRR